MSIELISPVNKAIICPIKNLAKDYIDNMHRHYFCDERDYEFTGINCGIENFTNTNNYYKRVKFFISQKPVKFLFKSSSKDKMIFSLSLDKDMKNVIYKKTTTLGQIYVDNLFINKTYFWNVQVNNEKSEVRSFVLGDYIRSISCGKVLNVRDIGGKMTKFGKRVKQGIIYRGREIVDKTFVDELNSTHNENLNKTAKKKLTKLLRGGVEIDLRGKIESNYGTKSVLFNKLNNIEYIRLDEIGAYDHYFVLDKPQLFDEVKKIFEIIADLNGRTCYLHCVAGADRTGTIIFFLESILGMKYVDMICDYEYTTFCKDYRNHYNPIPSFRKYMRFPEFYEEIMKYSNEHNLGNDIQTIIEHFLVKKVGLSKETIGKIRESLLE